MEPCWLTVEEVVRLHAMQIREFGGSSGIRDPALLESAVMRPRVRYHYGELRTIVDLATAYAVALSANHPFIDGNKRVSFFALLVFLRLHGLKLTVAPAEATEMMMALAAGRSAEVDIGEWVRSRV